MAELAGECCSETNDSELIEELLISRTCHGVTQVFAPKGVLSTAFYVLPTCFLLAFLLFFT